MNQPRRIASIICVRPGLEDRYVALHEDVPTAVLDRLRRAHVSNYSIFLRDGLLFSYFEYAGDDYEADMAEVGLDPATQAWWVLTEPCQQPVATAQPGEWWAPADEVFHLN